MLGESTRLLPGPPHGQVASGDLSAVPGPLWGLFQRPRIAISHDCLENATCTRRGQLSSAQPAGRPPQRAMLSCWPGVLRGAVIEPHRCAASLSGTGACPSAGLLFGAPARVPGSLLLHVHEASAAALAPAAEGDWERELRSDVSREGQEDWGHSRHQVYRAVRSRAWCRQGGGWRPPARTHAPRRHRFLAGATRSTKM